MKKLKILAIILARKNSKGLRNKNIKILNGKPLIFYTINVLKKSKYIDKIIVSTDCKNISNISKKFGADVPFLRPKSFARDLSTSEEALHYTLKKIIDEEYFNPDLIVYSQITEPFKTTKIIDSAIKLILKGNCDTVFAAKPFKKNLWTDKGKKLKRLNSFQKYGLPRQKKKNLFREDTGIVCVTTKKNILDKKRIGKKIKIIKYENPFDYIDIHNKYDFEVANFILKKKLFSF